MSTIDTSFLTKESQSFLSLFPPQSDPSYLSPAFFRDAPPAFISADVPRPDVTITRIQVPAFTDSHLFDVDVFRPKNPAPEEVLPALVYL